MIEIRQLNADEAPHYLGPLADVLIDCVEGGASVGFMMPLSRATAESFVAKVIEGVGQSERILLAAWGGGRFSRETSLGRQDLPNTNRLEGVGC